jgi:hypothetical protein
VFHGSRSIVEAHPRPTALFDRELRDWAVDKAESERDDPCDFTVQSKKPDPFVGNLAGVVLVGVAVTGWILYYTNAFPAVGGLLALGGLFSWLAFVSKVLPEKRLTDLQASADLRIFSNPRCRSRLVLVAALLAIAANFVGSIEVASVRDPVDRVVWIGASGDPADRPDRLGPGESIRAVRLTSWWAPQTTRVKVSGYPALDARVLPWRRLELHVPTSFRFAPCVLLHPTRAMMRHRNTDLVLQVTYGGQRQSRPFDGHTVWIGCDEDVEVPERLIEAWRAVPGEGDVQPLLAFWRRPVALTATPATLRPSDRINVTLVTKDGRPFPIAPLEITVRVPGRADDFPQVEELDLPRIMETEGSNAPATT